MTIRKDHKRKILKFRCFYCINFPSAILQEEKPQKKKMISLESQTEEHSKNELTEGDDVFHEDNA